MSITCFGSQSYTVQIAASKTPIDIKWFSAKYNIELEIRELYDNIWYRYVIGQFENWGQASAYINQNLSDKGLPSPFPRLLPDSLKEVIGSESYTIQIVAFKNPPDIKKLPPFYNLGLEVHKLHDKYWLQLVVGQFKTKEQAYAYIRQNLLDKGLPSPYPRILPDSLKGLISYIEVPINGTSDIVQAEPGQLKDTTTYQPADSIEMVQADSIQSEDTTTYQSRKSATSIPSYRSNYNVREKYGPWASIVGLKQLHQAEIAVIISMRSIMPHSWIPVYEKLIDRAIRYPIIIFFVFLIMLFFFNAIVIMIILELSNTLKNKWERFDLLYTNIYERTLTGYLFQEYDLETAITRLKNINRPRNRKILIDVLFNFKKNLSGELNTKLLEIFFRLGLEKDSYSKIRSNSFYQQILGIRELTNLYPTGAFPIVAMHINDQNDELRAEAQTSYVRLNHEEPFRFLKDLKKPFTRWTQLTSFYIFKLHMLPAPSFVEYLKSDMYNVRNFSLRMIIYFQQKENAEEITKLLRTEREMTRFLAIRAINELGIQEAKPLLKEIYAKETYKNRKEIIKGFLHIGDTNDFDFLESIIRQKDITLKIEACRSMYYMSKSGMEKLLSLKQDQELGLEPFIEHIYDPRN